MKKTVFLTSSDSKSVEFMKEIFWFSADSRDPWATAVGIFYSAQIWEVLQ
jgi:hypothetical protein